MTMKQTFYKFPSIEQFRTVIKGLRDQCEYHQLDPKSLLFAFEGTIKLHGTNASVILTKDGEYYAQSRNNVLSLEKDNAGFCAYAMQPKVKEHLINYLQSVLDTTDLQDREVLSAGIYGEWAGQGIQKGVAISEVERFFAPFGIAVYLKSDKETEPYERIWLSLTEMNNIANGELRIFPVTQYEPYIYLLNLDDIKLAQATQDLANLTNEVENLDPFAKQLFNVEGIGEGIVWKLKSVHNLDGSEFDKPIQFHATFKVKGEKHSVSKVKTIVQIDPEKLQKAQEFVEYALTENRLNQGIDYLKEQNLPIDMTSTGDIIRWVMNDILKEEQDVLLSNGLTWKSVQGNLAKTIKTLYVEFLDKNI